MRDPVAEIDFADKGDYYTAVITVLIKLVSQIHCIPVILQLRICRVMSGNIENFCTAMDYISSYIADRIRNGGFMDGRHGVIKVADCKMAVSTCCFMTPEACRYRFEHRV